MENTGYQHPAYTLSLSEFGEPLELPASEGWLLKRIIPGTSQFDGMGSYPIFSCKNWSNLENDLDAIGNQLVSVSLVTDPFGDYTQQGLQGWFKDIAKPYKNHFVVDLHKNPEEFVSRHHQRNARHAMEKIEIEIIAEPVRILDDWVSLYEILINRHQIKGVAKFSRAAFSIQLTVPGIVAVKATFQNRIVGVLLWYVQGGIAYYHLGAYTPEGYQRKASFALFWRCIEYFSDVGVKWLSLGAGAGIRGTDDGLTRFKSGWATGTRIAYFCGRIFDHQKYNKIVDERQLLATEFFPAYRAGEFL